LSNLLKSIFEIITFVCFFFLQFFVQLTRFYLTFLIPWIFAYLLELEGFIVLFFPPVMYTVAIVFFPLPHEHPRGGGGGLPKDGLVRFFHFVRSLFVNDPFLSFLFSIVQKNLFSSFSKLLFIFDPFRLINSVKSFAQ